MPDQLHNRKYLEGYRKELRNNSTKSESQLWKALQLRQLDGRKFRRQHSIGNYIVDFYCPSEQLIIELDGEVHNNPLNQEYDRKRTVFLESKGFTVIRFENSSVFDYLEMVLEGIKSSFKSEPPPPFGHPSFERRGLIHCDD